MADGTLKPKQTVFSLECFKLVNMISLSLYPIQVEELRVGEIETVFHSSNVEIRAY